MSVNGQLHAPTAVPTGSDPQYPLDKEAGWAWQLVWKSPAGYRIPVV
jgi:hypothetical protein